MYQQTTEPYFSLLLFDWLDSQPGQTVAGHEERQDGGWEEDELDDRAAGCVGEAQFTEEKESQQTPGSLAGPGESWVVVEQSNVGETPEVVEDQQHQRAVRQQLQGIMSLCHSYQ